MVRARVVQANIPVGNGVLHVIDNLLYFVYDNVVQRLGGMQETRCVHHTYHSDQLGLFR